MSYDLLISSIAEAHARTRAGAAGAVNRYLTLRNWLIGAHIVEFEQNGEDRASYGHQLLPHLARDLKRRKIPGCSAEMLGRMRSFYRTYPQLSESASQPLERESGTFRTLADQTEIPSPPVTESGTALPTPLDGQTLLRLSWSHIIELIRLDDPWQRAFYENGLAWVPDLTCDLWCSRTSFVASEQLGESGRIAVQKARYFAEGSHAELDGHATVRLLIHQGRKIAQTSNNSSPAPFGTAVTIADPRGSAIGSDQTIPDGPHRASSYRRPGAALVLSSARFALSAKPVATPAFRAIRPATWDRDARAMDRLLASIRPRAAGSPRIEDTHRIRKRLTTVG